MEAKICLLIVDDEVKFLDAIARRLTMRGFAVTKASSGEEAMRAARSQRFDIALLDLKMPGMDGQELLGLLKRDHMFLEVVILTGHGSLDSAVECTKLGAFSYLPKPYEFDKLIEVLRDAYRHRLERKFEHERERLDRLTSIAMGGSALGVLRKMRELDDEKK